MIAVPALAMAAAPQASASPSPTAKPSIFGGGFADPAAVPFAAAILYRGRFICSGSVVDSRHVVTAGHCAQFKLGKLQVVTGRYDLRQLATGQAHPVVAKYVHPDYRRKGRHDLSVFALGTPTSSPAVTLAQTAEGNADAAPGRALTVAGWGGTTPFHENPPGFLKSTSVNAVKQKRCGQVYGKGFVGKTMICGQGPKRTPGNKRSLRSSPCAGDSGGPLLGTNPDGAARLVGVVSYGPHLCGLPFAPIAYAKTYDPSGLAFLGAALSVPAP
ncbi:hypothetical protein BH20ACT15_BH20ACT15_06240 [soil metagenome]